MQVITCTRVCARHTYALAPCEAEACQALGSIRQHPSSDRRTWYFPTARAGTTRDSALYPCTVRCPARWDPCRTIPLALLRCRLSLSVFTRRAKMPGMHTHTHTRTCTHSYLPPPARRAIPPAANPSDLHTCSDTDSRTITMSMDASCFYHACTKRAPTRMRAHACGKETHHSGGQVGEASVTNGTPFIVVLHVQAASLVVTLPQPRPVRCCVWAVVEICAHVRKDGRVRRTGTWG